MSKTRHPDAARLVAYRALRDISADGAYANLALAARRRAAGLSARDAAFATELVNGVSRSRGTLDAIIATAAGRPLKSLQPAVIDALRLGAYQMLCLRVPPPAAVATTVDLAASQIDERVSGLVNAVLRRVGRQTWEGWLDELTAGLGEADALALRTCHPRWIVDVLAELLPDDEVAAALAADNQPPRTTLAVRPGQMERSALATAGGGQPTGYSPWGVVMTGDPGALAAVAKGRAGVQDEGSQLVVLAAARAAGALPLSGDTPQKCDASQRGYDGSPWLDLCAGPGGKTALLRGLAGDHFLVANEIQPHRAKLVAQALRVYNRAGHQVVAADGTRPAWAEGGFGFVLADVPCTGLGALRRRPEARWRHQPGDLDALAELQTALLESALQAARPGGLVAYATCSPHPRETAAIVLPAAARHQAELLDAPSYLPEVPNCAATTDTRFVQLWPHRHNTDAMFAALLRLPEQ